MTENHTHGFSIRIEVRWSDLDANRHLAHTSFLDYAVQARFDFLRDSGFGLDRLGELGIGPVVLRDEVEYRREVRAEETLEVTLDLAGMSDSGKRWLFHQEIRRADKTVAASVRSAGAWLDLTRRRLVTPPADLEQALRRLRHTDDFLDIER